jgi:aspartyl-tRNA(Asn)/glutamyl-tRNA(Gln) amidotransferase subunit A
MKKSHELGSTNLVHDPGELKRLAKALRKGELSATSLAMHYLERIESIDRQVKAWRVVKPKQVLQEAALRDNELRGGLDRGPLHGIPVAIKDIIDVIGYPTRANSKSRKDAKSVNADASIVATLRQLGCVVLGKAHTTEFALQDPSPARNPHAPDHTPGGSSSGSAAAVAAGMAPLAIGTQTVASVNRPAAYCGIGAFKPSTGSLPNFGITPLAPNYDTPGLLAYRAADAAFAYRALAPSYMPSEAISAASPEILVVEDPLIAQAAPSIQAAIETAVEAYKASQIAIKRFRSPIDFEKLVAQQRLTMLYECGHSLAHLRAHGSSLIGPKLWSAIHEGLAIKAAHYDEARRAIAQMRQKFFGRFKPHQVFLMPATPQTAPKGLDWTGDPSYIAGWTALGGPILTVPLCKDLEKLPIAALLSASPGQDRWLAHHCERLTKPIEHQD